MFLRLDMQIVISLSIFQWEKKILMLVSLSFDIFHIDLPQLSCTELALACVMGAAFLRQIKCLMNGLIL